MNDLTRHQKLRLKAHFGFTKTPFHKSMKANLGLESGDSIVLEGTVKGFIPLRNRRAGMVTHIGEAMTEYRCEGRTANGISEYLDQVP